jgi:hypothetical protein
MPIVTDYELRLYGTEDGWSGVHGSITLYNEKKNLGYIRFIAENAASKPDDYHADNKIVMYLPISRFRDTVDMLRNEKPIFYNFIQGHAILSTGTEPVGERVAEICIL